MRHYFSITMKSLFMDVGSTYFVSIAARASFGFCTFRLCEKALRGTRTLEIFKSGLSERLSCFSPLSLSYNLIVSGFVLFKKVLSLVKPFSNGGFAVGGNDLVEVCFLSVVFEHLFFSVYYYFFCKMAQVLFFSLQR